MVPICTERRTDVTIKDVTMVSLPVSDPEVALAFYRHKLKFEVFWD